MLYQSLSQSVDAVSVPCRGMFNKETIGKMKKGAYLINTARGGICDRDAVAEALESGQLLGEIILHKMLPVKHSLFCTILCKHMTRKSACTIQ